MIPLNLYKPLQYIESTGTQYIDTGLQANPAYTRTKMRVAISDTSGTTAFYGARGTSASSRLSYNIFGAVTGANGRFDNVNLSWPFVFVTNQWYDIELSHNDLKGTVIIDGVLMTTGSNDMSNQDVGNIYIGMMNNNGSTTIPGTPARFGTVEIWQDGTNLSGVFMPAQRLSDNVVGMYDDVTGEFFTNAGTGSFVAGPEDYSGTVAIRNTENLFDMKYDVSYQGSYPNITEVEGGKSTEWIETSKFTNPYGYYSINPATPSALCVFGLVYSNDKSTILYRDGRRNTADLPANTQYFGTTAIDKTYTYVKFYISRWDTVNNAGVYISSQSEYIPCIAHSREAYINDNGTIKYCEEAYSRTENLFDATTSRLATVGTLQSDGSYYFNNANLIGIWTPANKIVFNGKENTQYGIRVQIKSDAPSANVDIAFGVHYSDGTFSMIGNRGAFTDYHLSTGVTTANKTVIGFAVYYKQSENIYIKDLCVVEGSTAPTEYEPYIKRIFQAGYPTEVSSANPVQTDVANAREIDYKIYGNTKQAVVIDGKEYVVPDGYTLLEYIKTELGYSYSIATNIIAQETDKVIIDANIDSYSALGDKYLTSAANSWIDIAYNGSTWFLRFGSSSSSQISISGTIGQRIIYELYKQHFDINGTTIATPIYSSISGSWFIFGPNLGEHGAPCKLYSYKIMNTSTGDLRFAGIPAKNSSNVLGMYDLVTGQFFTNAGTSSFTAGPACPTPSAPLEIKFVGDRTSNLTNYVLNATVTGDGTGGGVASDVSSGVTWKENTRYTFSLDCTYSNVTYSQEGNLIFATIQYTDGTSSYTGITSVNYQQGRISFTSDANKTISSVPALIKHARWTGGTMTLSNWKIEEGTTATAYEPYGYKVPILQAQNCGVEHLGTSNWVRITRGDHYNFTCTTIPYKKGTSNLQHFLTAEGYTMSGGSLSNLPNMCYQLRIDGRCEFRNDALGGDVAAFKSAMSGKYLYYPRETDESFSQPTITPIYTQSPIYKVGTYTDTLLSAGLVNRKVGVKVLDGTENWTDASSGTKHIYYLPLAERKVGDDDRHGFCSHFGFSNGTSSTCPDLNMFYYGSLNTGFRYDAITSLADWKAFLASNPVTIVYPLATPTTETIETPTISTVKGTNIFDVETSVKPSNKTIDYVKRCK